MNSLSHTLPHKCLHMNFKSEVIKEPAGDMSPLCTPLLPYNHDWPCRKHLLAVHTSISLHAIDCTICWTLALHVSAEPLPNAWLGLMINKWHRLVPARPMKLAATAKAAVQPIVTPCLKNSKAADCGLHSNLLKMQPANKPCTRQLSNPLAVPGPT